MALNFPPQAAGDPEPTDGTYWTDPYGQQWVYKAASYFNLENAKDYLPDSYSFYLSRRDEYLDRAAKPA